MRKIIGFALAALVLVSFTRPAAVSALDCAGWPSIEEAYEHFDGIFVGRVEKVSPKLSSNNTIHLTVERSFKGVGTLKLTAEESRDWGALGNKDALGKSYLIFANKKLNGWEVPLCAPVYQLQNASEQLAFLSDKEIALVPSGTEAESTSGTGSRMGSELVSGQPDASAASFISAWAGWLIAALLFAALIGVIVLAYRRRRRSS